MLLPVESVIAISNPVEFPIALFTGIYDVPVPSGKVIVRSNYFIVGIVVICAVAIGTPNGLYAVSDGSCIFVLSPLLENIAMNVAFADGALNTQSATRTPFTYG